MTTNRFTVRVIREVTQFVDLVVPANRKDAALKAAYKLAEDPRIDKLFENNEKPFDGWDIYVNDGDVWKSPQGTTTTLESLGKEEGGA